MSRPQDDSVWSGWLRPLLVLASTLGLAFVLWGIEERSHRGRLHLETEITAQQAGARLADWLDDRMGLTAFLAEKWPSEYAADPGRFEADAARFIHRFPGIQAINWVDPAGIIRRVVPSQGNEAALNADLTAHPDTRVRNALETSLREKRLARTPAIIELLQGGKGFATYQPVFAVDGAHIGYINAVFRVTDLVDACMGRMRENQHFHFAIREADGALIYPRDASQDFSAGPDAVVQQINVADRPWFFCLEPAPAYIRELRLAAHHLILPAGVLVALVLAFFERVLLNRKKALLASQAKYQALFEQAPVAYFSVGPDTLIERANRAAEAITGRSIAELEGSAFYDLLPESGDHRSVARMLLDAVYRGEALQSRELCMRRPNGQLLHTVLYVDGVYDEGGIFSRYRVAAVDVTERREAEEVRTRLSAAIDQSEEGVVITSRTGTILYINPSAGAGKVPGSPMLHTASLEAFLQKNGATPEVVAEISLAMKSEVAWRGSCPIRRGDGAVIPMVSTLSPIRDPHGLVINFVFIQRDISHEVELQAQLQQARKLEAVGRLAGGIAHDFNNILQSLLGYATLARRNPSNAEDVSLCLDEIERAGHRAANLVAHILAFGRQSVVDRKPLMLRHVVEEVAALVRGALPAGINLALNFSDNEHPVLADATQIHQVLMNLASNALHALRDGGTLTIRYEAAQLSGAEAARWPVVGPGPCMRLTVRDDGVGMAPEVLDRIFEPYFSTRQTGTGTGLGLATVHGIVENHGGAIFAESAPGQGASFTILLPAVPSNGRSAVPVELSSTTPAGDPPAEEGGKIRILYVDDEAQIVDSMRRILERYGFEVTGFTSSRAAFEALQGNPMRYDLLVTDLSMPEMNGIELARAASALRSGLPVILCSGYSDSFEKSIGENADLIRAFLKKPVSARELAAEIRRVVAPEGTTQS